MAIKKSSPGQIEEPKANRAKRYPDNPFDWMTFHTDKLNALRDQFAKLLQTPSGIEELRAWNPQQKQTGREEALSKKIRFVVSTMQKNPAWEEEFFNMAKVKVKMANPKKNKSLKPIGEIV